MTKGVWLGEDGIIRIEQRDARATLSDIEGAHRERSRLDSDRRPILLDARGVSSVDREVYEYAKGDDMVRATSALAVVTDSWITRQVLKMLLKREGTTPYPVRIFGDGDEALAWLRSFVDEPTKLG